MNHIKKFNESWNPFKSEPKSAGEKIRKMMTNDNPIKLSFSQKIKIFKNGLSTNYREFGHSLQFIELGQKSGWQLAKVRKEGDVFHLYKGLDQHSTTFDTLDDCIDEIIEYKNFGDEDINWTEDPPQCEPSDRRKGKLDKEEEERIKKERAENRRASEKNADYKRNKKNADHPKGETYDTILSTIKQREEQLRAMSPNDKDYDSLRNDLESAKSGAARMKNKYKFEHLLSTSFYKKSDFS